MKKAVFWISVLCPYLCLGQGFVTGRVIDGKTKKPLRDASVKVVDTTIQTTTNFLGFFQLVADSSNTLLVYQVGYDTSIVKVPPVSKFQIELFRDTIPEYEGGMSAFYDFMARHLIYPSDARVSEREGWVFVAFDIDSLKGMQNIRIIRDIGGHCGSTVAKTISELPGRWIPRTESCTMILPVRFLLEGRNRKSSSVTPTVELPAGILMSNIIISAIGVTRDSYSWPPGR